MIDWLICFVCKSTITRTPEGACLPLRIGLVLFVSVVSDHTTFSCLTTRSGDRHPIRRHPETHHHRRCHSWTSSVCSRLFFNVCVCVCVSTCCRCHRLLLPSPSSCWGSRWSSDIVLYSWRKLLRSIDYKVTCRTQEDMTWLSVQRKLKSNINAVFTGLNCGRPAWNLGCCETCFCINIPKLICSSEKLRTGQKNKSSSRDRRLYLTWC